MLKSINNIYEKMKYITIFCTEFYFQNVFFLISKCSFPNFTILWRIVQKNLIDGSKRDHFFWILSIDTADGTSS